MNEDSTFRNRRAAWKDNRDLHILELGSFPVMFGLGLVAKECNQIGLWTFVTF